MIATIRFLVVMNNKKHRIVYKLRDHDEIAAINSYLVTFSSKKERRRRRGEEIIAREILEKSAGKI